MTKSDLAQVREAMMEAYFGIGEWGRKINAAIALLDVAIAAPTSVAQTEREAMRKALSDCLDYGSMTGADWVVDQARAALAAPKQPMSALTDEQIISAVNTVHTADIGGDYWLTPIGMVVVARAVLAAAQGEKK